MAPPTMTSHVTLPSSPSAAIVVSNTFIRSLPSSKDEHHHHHHYHHHYHHHPSHHHHHHIIIIIIINIIIIISIIIIPIKSVSPTDRVFKISG
jgi:hypothetical protein